jgi:heterodisulfide reductase subunit C
MELKIPGPMMVPEFMKQVESIIGQSVAKCYQCGNCTAGCPAAPEMDFGPQRIIRVVQLGLKEPALSSNTIWTCASCVTCTTRCPQEVDITGVMDALRIISQRESYRVRDRNVTALNKIFLGNIRSFGRQYEIGLIGKFNVFTRQFFKDVGLGPKMFFKGKLKLFPHRSGNVGEVREIFRRAKEESSSPPSD